ncbi:hypothetical protein [Micromonospora sp. NPDC004704]
MTARRRPDGAAAPLQTFDRPPDVDTLVGGLERLLRDGLPATEETADPALLGLRGVWARSNDPDDVLSRVEALNKLLAGLIPKIPPQRERDWARGAEVLFKLAPATAKLNLSQRYERGARAIPYNEDHFRQEIVPKILRQIARELRTDSQRYIPTAQASPQPELTGDAPGIRGEHLSSRDRALYEERLSRLWEYVYGLRAELMAVERLKAWPEDEEHGAMKLEEARDSALWQTARLMHWIAMYLREYDNVVPHGDAEYRAEALLRLAGWRAELPPVVATKLRTLAAMYSTREKFLRAAREAGLNMGEHAV